MKPPAPSGLDAYRLLFVPPAGEAPGMPAESDPNLHRTPGSGIARVQRRAIEKFEGIGYRFVQAERKPDANGRGEWPWEEIEVPEEVRHGRA